MTAAATDDAINRVLHAEEAARESVATCRQEAKESVKRARIRASWILERADGRIGAIRERCERCVSAEVARIEAEGREALAAQGDEGQVNGLLDRVLAQVADEVTGAT